MKIVVIGAGIAGSAAAWAASRAGAEVVVVSDRSGASELYSGAIDREAWEVDDDEALDSEVLSFVTALGLWTATGKRCLLATPAGVLRSAQGRDSALLDVLPLAGKSIAVADVVRNDWDAELVARGLSGSAFAKETGTRFTPVDLPLAKLAEARTISGWDLAHGFDAPERLEELAAALETAKPIYDAWLLGPWLGTRSSTIEALHKRVRMPVGESTSPPGGAAGARFEHARDALFEGLKATTRLSARVTAIEPNGKSGWSVKTNEQEITSDRVVIAAGGAAGARFEHARDSLLESLKQTTRLSARVTAIEPNGKSGWCVKTNEQEITSDRVVIAAGGVAAGGIQLDGARPDHPGGACFHLSFVAPVTLELDGLSIDGVSSLYGVDFAARGLGTLERIGIACTDGVAVRGAVDMYAAGDAVSGRARTVLTAVSSGIRAATRAMG